MKKRSILLLFLVFVAVYAIACAGRGGGTSKPTPLAEKPTATPFITPAAIERPKALVNFSINDNFLDTTGRLELSADNAKAIYYTLDGSTPTEKSTKYTAPITLMAGVNTKAYVVSARALYQDGTMSETVVRTYFAGKNIAERYDCLVVSVVTDPSNLWDYETGIFTGGKILAEYKKKHPGANIDGGTPANYNQLRGMEGERPCSVEIYNADGSLIISQPSGLRCYGGWSRANAMKPMKLLARKEYSETDNKFRYPFFTESFDENNELIDAFKRLVLRAAGNDNGYAFLREELFQTLAKQAGYLGKSVRPCAVYVNGEYYGAYWLTEVYHESYFETHYGKFNGTMEILEGGELFKNKDDDGGNIEACENYEQIYNYFSKADLTDETVFSELCECIDVQNYIEYYAYQIFIGNEDWPNNNYKTYRYFAAEGEEYGEAPFDGKWRYLLHDMDFSTGIYNAGVTARSYTYYLGRLNGSKDSICPLFGRLMQRDDCKQILITKMLDLINGVFAPDYFNNQVDLLNESRLNEQSYSYKSGKLSSWITPAQLDERIAALKGWIKSRGNYMYNNTYSFFKIQGANYELNVNLQERDEVSINSWTVTENFTGRYYSSVDTILTAEDKYGRKAVGWKVNDNLIDGERLVLNDEIIGDNKTVTVEAVFE